MLPGRRSRPAAAVLVLLLLLAGCWDRRDIEERATSLITGVDLCKEEEDCFLVSTRQFAIPGQIPMGPGSRGAADTVQVLRSPGQNGPDSMRKAQAELHREISFAHTRLLVVGDAFARSGMQTYLDYVWRLPEVRRLMWIAVVEGRAEDVVRARPELDPVPALYLNDMLQEAVNTGRLPAQSTLGDFMTRMSNHGEDPVAPLLRVSDPNYPEIAGLAVFRDATLVGILGAEEVSAFMALQERGRSAQAVKVPLPGDRWARIALYGRDLKQDIRFERGRIHVRQRLSLEGDLVETSPGVYGSDPSVRALIERRADQEIRRRIMALLGKLQQEYKADILGVGARVRAFLPQAWEQIPDWREAFAAAEFTVEVTVNVRRTGPVMD